MFAGGEQIVHRNNAQNAAPCYLSLMNFVTQIILTFMERTILIFLSVN